MTRALTMAGLLWLALASPAFLTSADKDEKSKEEKADFQVYDGYFESNKSGLDGKASFLVFTNQAAFDKVFRPVPPLGGKKKTLLPADAFEGHLVAAVIKRGDRVWTYKVLSVAPCKGKVTITYEAKAPETGGSATFASPLIVRVPRPGNQRVAFVENGVDVSTVEVGKE
jgi:hypothetical protein